MYRLCNMSGAVLVNFQFSLAEITIGQESFEWYLMKQKIKAFETSTQFISVVHKNEMADKLHARKNTVQNLQN